MAREPAHRPSAAHLGDQIRHLQQAYGFKVDDLALRVAAEVSASSANYMAGRC
jgi:hypothetical protein